MKKSLRIRNDLQQLNTLRIYLQSLESEWHLGQKIIYEINIILDELITNIIEHGGSDKNTFIDITLDKKGRSLTIEVSDEGPPFNPTLCALPDTSLSLERRKCGGLGILLVRRFSDSCRYKRLENKNVLTLHKILPKECG